jgi:hypothetical protein
MLTLELEKPRPDDDHPDSLGPNDYKIMMLMREIRTNSKRLSQLAGGSPILAQTKSNAGIRYSRQQCYY